jgi:tetratricopeptide (TPR) repeat protein
MCFKESLKINEEKKYYDGIADNYLAYGNLNRDFGNIDQAKECYENALEVYKKLELNDKVHELSVSIEQLNLDTKPEIFESTVYL